MGVIMKKSETIKFIDNQINITQCFRKELLHKGILTLSRKEHYETIDHLSSTLIAIKMILIAMEKEDSSKG